MKSISYCLMLSLFALALCSFSSTSAENVNYNFVGSTDGATNTASRYADFVEYISKAYDDDRGTWNKFNKAWELTSFSQIDAIELALDNIAD